MASLLRADFEMATIAVLPGAWDLEANSVCALARLLPSSCDRLPIIYQKPV
jgi:hypothetical protein